MFRQMTLLVGAGLIGPLLATGRRWLLPVVIGELGAGALIGRTGFQLIDPHASVFPVFYSLGFAMLMMTAGTHVDIRSPDLRSGAPKGAVALLVVFVGSAPLGFAISGVLGVGHPFLLAVLLAGSSAAVAFPIIEERGLDGPVVSFLVAWIAFADSITVVLMPLGLTGAGKVIPSLIGDGLIVIAGVAALLLALRIHAFDLIEATVKRSVTKGWALQLRLSVLLLLGLASIAEGTGASLLVAGFVAGMVLVRMGQPDRLALQISGVANGFFVPLFFVLLGAELDLRAMASDPQAIALAVSMAVAAVAVHLVAALVTGNRQTGRVAAGLSASAQLGLPAAAASLALADHLLSPAIAAALVAAGCLTLAPATIGAARLEPETP
ncbi:MAG TPA: cation:proton antiporter [Candidatus Solibacter sp.]|jgi:Kef-type K+ transport system membrane component KefB|nr:cation:proton antiporter [Candidatus Solibacter sp.]